MQLGSRQEATRLKNSAVLVQHFAPLGGQVAREMARKTSAIFQVAGIDSHGYWQRQAMS